MIRVNSTTLQSSSKRKNSKALMAANANINEGNPANLARISSTIKKQQTLKLQSAVQVQQLIQQYDNSTSNGDSVRSPLGFSSNTHNIKLFKDDNKSELSRGHERHNGQYQLNLDGYKHSDTAPISQVL